MAAASSSSLPLFWDLASNDESKRLGSSSKLVSSLSNQQSALPSSSKATLDQVPPSPIETFEDAVSAEEDRQVEQKLDRLLASEVSYSLRRLTRGLASPREQSRLGFAVALTELLARTSALTARDVLVLVIKYSTPAGKVSRSEERNLLFARLFGVQALVRSGVLARPSTTEGDVTRAVSVLIELGNKKSPLRESAGWVMVQMLDEAVTGRSLLQAVVKTLSAYATSDTLTPEKLAILLRTSQVDPSTKLQGRVASLKGGDILGSANLPILAKLLRNAPSADEAAAAEAEDGNVNGKVNGASKAKSQTGSFNPRVHFVWDVILDVYYGPLSTPSATRAPFADLYSICVDESLFSQTASAERKSWGFQVFSKALPLVPSTEKPLLFTQNFMRTWINQLASKDRFLHSAATGASAAVQAVVAQDPRTGFALTSQLMGKHGSHNFDRLTNTKTVEGLLSSMDSAGVIEYANYVVKLIGTSTEDSVRRWGLDQLLALVRNTAIPTDDKSTEAILQYFMAGGFFSWNKAPRASSESLISQQPKPAFSESMRSLCRSRLLSCLSELTERTTSVTEGENKTRRAQGVNSEGQLWISRAWDLLTAMSKDTKTFTRVAEETDADAITAGTQLLDRIRKSSQSSKDAKQKGRLASFEVLLLATLLYIAESPEDANDLIEPLEDCFESMFERSMPNGKSSASKPGAKAAGDGDDDDGDEPEGIELLQDYLVGLLERSSSFLRAIAEQTFSGFVDEINEPSIDHLIDQLGLSEEPAAEGSGGDEDAEMANEDEEADDDDSSETSSDSGDVDSEADSDEDGENGQGEPVDEELRREVLDALRSVGMADEDEDEDAEAKGDADADGAGDGAESDAESTDSLPDFTDEQMLQVDDRLAEIFRSRVNTKKNSKEAKQDSIAFQNKIMDLLAIFAKKQSSNPLVLRLVRPLFVIATEGADALDKQVSDKATLILKSSICRDKDVPKVADYSPIAEDLEAVHSFAQRSTDVKLSSLANTVNLYLTRVGLEARDGVSSRALVMKQYEATLKDYLTRNASQLKPQFLLDAFKKFPSVGWFLRTALIESCSSKAGSSASGEKNVKEYRQLQSMQMVSCVLNQNVVANATSTNREEVLNTLRDVAELVFSTVHIATTMTSVSAPKLKEILKLGLQAARLTKRFDADDAKSIWKASKIQEASTALTQSDRFKQSGSLTGLLKQMGSIIEGGGSAKKDKNKRKSGAGEGEGEEQADGVAVTAAKKSKTVAQGKDKVSAGQTKKDKKGAKVNGA